MGRISADSSEEHECISYCAAGADRQPELLQHIFGCLSGVLRHLAQWLAAGLPGVLQETAPLRYSSARHVRQLAAQSMSFLLRHARGKALRSGVRTIYAGAAPVLGKSAAVMGHLSHSESATRIFFPVY